MTLTFVRSCQRFDPDFEFVSTDSLIRLNTRSRFLGWLCIGWAPFILKEHANRRGEHIVVLSGFDVPEENCQKDQGNDQTDSNKHDDDDHGQY